MRITRTGRSGQPWPRVAMLLENDLYPQDVRVRYEAESLARAGYRVRVIAPRGSAQRKHEEIDGVVVERFWLPMEHEGRTSDLLREYSIAHCQLYVRGLRAILRGTDVLHVHNPPDTLFVPAWICRPTGCRLAFDQHDLFPELTEERAGAGPFLVAARLAQHASVKLADLVIATNESQRDAVVRAGASPERVIVVRNGLRRGELSRGEAVRVGRLEDPRLVYVGALERQDGVAQIPSLLRMLIDRHGLKGVSMTIVGSGAERTALERSIAGMGLADRVAFTGRTEHGRVLELIAGADICIDPADCTKLNHQSTMVKVVEYLSLGRPTVAFALRETERTTGDAAALAPCGDLRRFAELVAQIAAAQSRRAELSTKALARAQALVWEHSQAALLAGYERMLR